MNRLITLVLALPLFLSTVACTESQPQESTGETVVAKAAPTPAEQVPAADPVVASAELEELVRSIQPRESRDGSLRFSSARLLHPSVAPLLLNRLRAGNEGEQVRIALIRVLPLTQGEYAAEAVTMLKSERSEAVRASLVDAMRLANDGAAALEGLKLGMNDSSTHVRSRSAFAIGRRADGKALADVLTDALSNTDAELQAAAARALGNLGAADAFDKVAPLVASREADVRLESLRALGRMDAERAAAIPELTKLTQDSDQRVRTAASKVAAKSY